MTVLTSLETIKVPLASTVYILLQDLSTYLEAGSRKTSSGRETDRLLAKLPHHEKDHHLIDWDNITILDAIPLAVETTRGYTYSNIL